MVAYQSRWMGGGNQVAPSHPCGKQKSVYFRQRFFFSPWMRGGQPSCPPNDTKSQKSRIFQWLRKTTQPTKIETLGEATSKCIVTSKWSVQINNVTILSAVVASPKLLLADFTATRSGSDVLNYYITKTRCTKIIPRGRIKI